MARLPFRIPLKTTLAAMSVGALALGYSMATQHPVAAYSDGELRLLFAEFDRDMNDAISPEEFAAFVAEEEAEDEVSDEAHSGPGFPVACAGTFVEEEYLEEQAEAGARDPAAEFATLDSNRDGRLEFDEIAAMVIAEHAREFIEHDEDGNGFVTLAEVEAMLTPEPIEILARELADEGLPQPCIDAILAEEAAGRALDADEDPAREARLLIAEHDLDRDGRVGLMEYLDR